MFGQGGIAHVENDMDLNKIRMDGKETKGLFFKMNYTILYNIRGSW
jgi:hypothetical protein